MAEFSAGANSMVASQRCVAVSSSDAEAPLAAVRTRRRTRLLVLAVLIASAVASWFIAPRGQADASACDELRVDVLALQRCVVPGGQAELDAGYVVRFDALSTSNVHWITGHRTSHGATFNSLTNLQLGDRVAYRGAAFVIAEYQLVDRHAPAAVATWMNSSVPRLVLQTSASSPFVHVWRAELAPPSPNPDSGDRGADSSTGGSGSDDAPLTAKRVNRVVAAPVVAEGDTLAGQPSGQTTTPASSAAVTPSPAASSPAASGPGASASAASRASASDAPLDAAAHDRPVRRTGVPYWRTWLR